MYCTHQGNNYGCTGKFCRHHIAVILMIVNVFLLAHILFPHHHHFYNASCEQEQEHETCEVEIEKALLRINSGRYDSYLGSSVNENMVPPVLPPIQTDCLPFVFLRDAGRIFLFPPLVLQHEAQICCGTLSLRAPPLSSL